MACHKAYLPMPPMGRKRLRPRSITYKQILPLNSLHLLLKRLHPDSIPITNERYLIGKPNYFRVSDKVSEYFQLKHPKNASLKMKKTTFSGYLIFKISLLCFFSFSPNLFCQILVASAMEVCNAFFKKW